MPMRLVLEDDKSGIPIPVDDLLWEAWLLQYSRAVDAGELARFRERLAGCFALSMVEFLDADLKPPTEAQLRYATDIAQGLGIALPSDALRYRGSMAEFIDRHVESFRQRRRGKLRDEPEV